MNRMLKTPNKEQVLLRKAEIYSFLDQVCQELEPTETQFEAAKISYEAVADWLSKGDDPVLKSLKIYLHGSTALGTAIKPLLHEEYDVDLICLVPSFSSQRHCAELKGIVGKRLGANSTYANMLEEKKRCWRLNYARQFHLDISPTIPNPACANGGELVPDKKLSCWKPTNPKGYKLLFEKRSKLMPRLRIQKATIGDARANTEIFPTQKRNKSILCRIVQILKRHRDTTFQIVKEDIAPISIILTTLASKSYEFCTGRWEFDTELDAVIEVIRLMPAFIERPVVAGRQIYLVANETTQGENFAERWNSEPQRAEAFFKWHGQVLEDLEKVAALEGIDLIVAALEKMLGTGPVRKVLDAKTGLITKARTSGKLFVAPAVGLTLSQSARATSVPRNTFFGDK